MKTARKQQIHNNDYYYKMNVEDEINKKLCYKFYELNWRAPALRELKKMGGIVNQIRYDYHTYLFQIGFLIEQISFKSFDVINIETNETEFSGTSKEIHDEYGAAMNTVSYYSKTQALYKRKYKFKEREVIYP